MVNISLYNYCGTSHMVKINTIRAPLEPGGDARWRSITPSQLKIRTLRYRYLPTYTAIPMLVYNIIIYSEPTSRLGRRGCNNNNDNNNDDDIITSESRFSRACEPPTILYLVRVRQSEFLFQQDTRYDIINVFVSKLTLWLIFSF